ncbi:M48 family metallopeptidase [Streptomyces sp. NPDC052225]|uniref:M48 family metallopeptidase n=1 Tax=Streptomyces sp. NPDC052225 TaxID=3154949 RepID=UPI0034279B64
MTHTVEETVQPCPQCGDTIRSDARFTTWCTGCDWNVDPAAPDPDTGRLERARRALARRHGERLIGELTAGGGERPVAARRDLASVAALALALAVHGVTLAFTAGGVWLLVTGWGHTGRLIGAAMLLAVACALRPSFGKLPDDRPVLHREAAPALFALVDEVAAGVGTRGVDAVALDLDVNASVTTYGLRGRRLLTLGVPLWEMLGPQERVALLGHELGHFGNGDTRHGMIVAHALRSLGTWHYFVAATPRPGPLEAVLNVLRLPARMFVTGVSLLLDGLTLRAAQRAEYLADTMAARAASTDAAVRLLDVLLVAPSAERMLRTEGNARQVRSRAVDADGLWERLAAHTRSVPEREYERLRRAGARRGHSVDSTHPPTHLRRRLLTGGAPVAAAVRTDAAHDEAVAGELADARARLARELLRDGLRG